MSATASSDTIPQTLAHALSSLQRLTALGSAAAPPPPLPRAGAADASAAAADDDADGGSGSGASPRAGAGAAAAADAARLEAKVRDVTELNDRIMAQNIALMADLEAAQRAVRELRAAKDALASQLKRALLAAEAREAP